MESGLACGKRCNLPLRRMASRYSGRCKKCRTSFAAGDEILWSKATGALCISCGSSQSSEGNSGGTSDKGSETKAKPKKGKGAKTSLPSSVDSGRDSFFTVEWSALKGIVREALESNEVPSVKRAGNKRSILSHTTGVGGGFYGYTSNQLKRWVTEGYDTDALRGLGEFDPPLREKRRYRYVEDGDEIIVDRALSGDDTFMAEFTPRPNIPGVAIEAEIMFAAMVSAEVVNAYNVFVCKALLTLESEGIDCQVTLKFSSDDAGDDGKFYHSIVRVKKENEATDFRSFSAMLSPAALRTFGFVALALQAESNGSTVSHTMGLGNRSSHKWTVEWNSERRVLEFRCPYTGSREFPEAEMYRKLRAALHSMKRGE